MNNIITNDLNSYSSLDTQELLDIKNKINTLISNYKLIINNYDNLLNTINKNIYDKCNHNWIIDHYSINEHTEYTCSYCNLNK